MTEQEWITSADPLGMLEWLTIGDGVGRGTNGTLVSDRKLACFSNACRAMSNIHADTGMNVRDLAVARGWAALDDHPPDIVSKDARVAILRDVVNPFRPVYRRDGEYPKSMDAVIIDAEWITPQVVQLVNAAYRDNGGRTCERCKGFKEVSHPDGLYRHGRIACPDCHGSGKTGVGTLDPLTLLAVADAMEEAGCSDGVCPNCKGDGRSGLGTCLECAGGEWELPTGRVPHPLIAHLRGSGGGVHYRGCWVLDLLLGNE